MTDAWPELGRLARVTSGDWEGCLALVTDERAATGRFFVIYIASDEPGDSRATDFVAEMDEQGGFGMGLDWLPPDEDLRLEATFFGVRKHMEERQSYRALPAWRRVFRRQGNRR